MDQDLLSLLESAGFTQKEASVYLALLELGQGKVSGIAKITQLKRPIIYVVLEGLIKRGYISELPEKKINTYQAVDPSVILRQLRVTAKNFSEMLPVLRTLRSKGKKRPRISYFETKEAIWKIYEDMSCAKSAFFITSYVPIEKQFNGGVTRWIQDYQKGLFTVKGRHLIPDNMTEKAFGKKFIQIRQEVRFLPEVPSFEMDFTIFENKLAITSLEDEPFLVMIESEALVKSMRPFFELAWKSGKEIC